ncbi:tetratricopeptide repeat protein [Gluconobacter morbifer]|uniref:Uncharacterized protein n=1 Tax=Gluconobacter morbifer G707 TaxID=1088869 RepID=G6XJM5_9PROT|nr:hypothetical protein [Gluconobacter morbifer]EHH67837.1 hypothetical protein GMO_16040 [Gluconobacter morbifer G707]
MTEKRRWLLAGAVLLSAPGKLSAAPPASAPPAVAPSQATKSPAPASGKTQPEASARPHRRTLHERLLAAEKALAMAGNEKQARELADQAEALRSRALTGSTRMLLTDSQEALGKNDFQTAEEDMTSALTIQPDQFILRRQRAAVRLAAGDNNGAIEDLGIELQSDPGDPTAWGMLAEAEHERHEPDAALRAYHQMMLLDPKAPDADRQLKTLQKEKEGQED